MDIKNIKDLITSLEELGPPKNGHTRFFRGHSDLSYDLIPSIYRNDESNTPHNPDYLIKNEHNIVKDALTNCPDSFSQDHTLFEKLVRLQHYGYATRLLDLTSNALVGLYFAAQTKQDSSKEEDKDGELIVLDIPNEEIKYDDSDVVSILSATSLRKADFSIKDCVYSAHILGSIEALGYIIENYKNLIDQQTIDTFKEIDLLKNKIDGALSERIASCLEKILSTMNKDAALYSTINFLYEERRIKSFNEQKEISRLLHDIKKEKPGFAPLIESNDFKKVVCVRAKLNNQRITNQQGCFLLFGINNKKTEMAKIQKEWQRTPPDNSGKLIIKKESKQPILKELETFGISKQGLFPELDSQAKEIMEKYRHL